MGDKAYLHSLAGGVLVPALQSVITGLLSCFVAAGIAYLAGVNIGLALVLGGGAAAAVCWLLLLRHWLMLTSPLVELPEVYADALPEPERIPVRIELKSSERSISFIDLPAEPEQLSALASGLLAGAPLSEAAWTGSRGIFSRSQFSALRSELIRRQLCVWNNPDFPSQGVSLTCAGKALFAHFLTSPAPAELVEQ